MDFFGLKNKKSKLTAEDEKLLEALREADEEISEMSRGASHAKIEVAVAGFVDRRKRGRARAAGDGAQKPPRKKIK